MSTPSPERLLLLGVSGSVAAYKSVTLARLLLGRGFSIQPLLTESAKQFVGAATWLGITGRPALDSIFDGQPGERHVDLWRTARAMLIVPASADVLARLAQGHASDLVTATALCRKGPLFVAPAMHPSMWHNAATQRNVATLVQDGVEVLGPTLGEVASLDVGMGRMLEPDAIAARVVAALAGEHDLTGVRVLVSAGPTVEDLDPVRFIGNRSSGKMGYAIASAAASRGADVDLVSGPVALSAPSGVRVHPVRSALEMLAELERHQDSDAIIMAAAVGDFRPRRKSPDKLKKNEGATFDGATASMSLELVQNPDIIQSFGERRRGARPLLVAFAVETGSDEEILRSGRAKLERKKVDVLLANSAEDGFGGDENRVQWITKSTNETLPKMTKLELAHLLLDRLSSMGLGRKA